jgi:ATP-binding cassette, subfamily B, bacterial
MVRLESFDQDAFADEMERAWRGCESTTQLVQAAINLLAGAIGVLAIAIAVIVIHPVLLVALVIANVPSAWAALRAGHLQYQTYLASTVRRRRLWLLNHHRPDRTAGPARYPALVESDLPAGGRAARAVEPEDPDGVARHPRLLDG